MLVTLFGIVMLVNSVQFSNASLPMLFTGGVCANTYLKDAMRREFGDVYFAPPALSGDNALGCAYAAYLDDIRRNQVG